MMRVMLNLTAVPVFSYTEARLEVGCNTNIRPYDSGCGRVVIVCAARWRIVVSSAMAIGWSVVSAGLCNETCYFRNVKNSNLIDRLKCAVDYGPGKATHAHMLQSSRSIMRYWRTLGGKQAHRATSVVCSYGWCLTDYSQSFYALSL